MSISLQQLRSTTPGVQPLSLSPGQICFNVADRVMYVGDGSNFKKSFDGTEVAGVAGAGWFSIPLTFNALGEYYIANPQYYNDNPLAGQVLTWDSTAGHAVWISPDDVGGAAYLTTNALVAGAPGLGVNEKISNALGIVPQQGDTVIVSGVPGEIYQGYYQFISGSWRFAAQNAFPTASQVPLSPIAGLSATTVQAGVASAFTLADAANTTANTAETLANQAIGDAQAAQTTADTALLEANSAQEDATAAQITANLALTASQSAEAKADDAVQAADEALATAELAESKADDAVQTADEAFTLASSALPKSGGTMTGDIVFNNGQLVDAGTY